jgi:hypothetical protein
MLDAVLLLSSFTWAFRAGMISNIMIAARRFRIIKFLPKLEIFSAAGSDQKEALCTLMFLSVIFIRTPASSFSLFITVFFKLKNHIFQGHIIGPGPIIDYFIPGFMGIVRED